MTIFDLVFLISFFATVFMFARFLYLFIFRRRGAAKKIGLRLLLFLGGYGVCLVAVSLAAPQKVLTLGELQCFDEWCISIEDFAVQEAIGDIHADGVFYVVAAQVSNRGRGRRQREPDVDVYLADVVDRRFDVSPAGQAALDKSGIAGEPLTAFVDAGASFLSRLAFDVPIDAAGIGFVKESKGWFPHALIIGGRSSFLHRRTVVRLAKP